MDDDHTKLFDLFFGNMDDAAAKAKEDKSYAIEKAFQLSIRIEQAPNPDSRVMLDTEVDELGVPRLKLNWALTELDKYSIRTINKLVGMELGKSGFGRMMLHDYLQDEEDYSWPSGTNGGWHHMGTTRMSNDPKTGVVDQNCKVHGLSNLYMAGSSCFATSGAPNPTLTLVALSLRLSDHLKTLVS